MFLGNACAMVAFLNHYLDTHYTASWLCTVSELPTKASNGLCGVETTLRICRSSGRHEANGCDPHELREESSNGAVSSLIIVDADRVRLIEMHGSLPKPLS